jgi:hypothetical protein
MSPNFFFNYNTPSSTDFSRLFRPMGRPCRTFDIQSDLTPLPFKRPSPPTFKKKLPERKLHIFVKINYHASPPIIKCPTSQSLMSARYLLFIVKIKSLKLWQPPMA